MKSNNLNVSMQNNRIICTLKKGNSTICAHISENSHIPLSWTLWSSQTFFCDKNILQINMNKLDKKMEQPHPYFGYFGHSGESCFCRSTTKPLYRRGIEEGSNCPIHTKS